MGAEPVRSIKRLGAAALAGLMLTSALPAIVATSAHASSFNPNGLYDCQVYQAGLGYFTHVDYYKFGPHQTYSVSLARSGHTLKAPVTKGRYHLKGNKIVPSSGILKKLHDYLLIQGKTLVGRTNSGHITGLSCILIYPKPPATKPSNPKPPGSVPFPLGAYTCWQTAPTTDPLAPAGTYDSNVVTTVTFNADGTYTKSGSLVGGDWHEGGSTIVFTSGVLWQGGSYDQGLIYPSGTAMPNAVAPATASGYTLVIKDTKQEGGSPPSQEFSSTDGPNGSYSPPASFFYCK
jgi:hypothetical protein